MNLLMRYMLRYDEKTQTFKTTEKGLRVLQAYSELSEFMKGIEPNQRIIYIESQA
jgi:predicted transcriptional regulator